MDHSTNNNMAQRERVGLHSAGQRTRQGKSVQGRSGKARTSRSNSTNAEACEGRVIPASGRQYHTSNDSSGPDSPKSESIKAASPQKINRDFEAMFLGHPGGPAIFQAFQNASQDPPITPESLTELDMPRIINNPKLRHDVNFDRELHFRPNLDGARGKQKMKCADTYWKALEGELFMLDRVQKLWSQPGREARPGYWEGLMKASRKRLPRIFEVVRDILKTLVPDIDQPKIVERLDVDLLIQQIDNGMCDLVDLANWLAKVLKNHCAPMRDAMVDKMQSSITKGVREANHVLMVDGLRQLLNILEAMKLDVANHQIRHMRPLLVADTINFQQRYNEHRISLCKLDAEASRIWLQKAHDDLCELEGTTLNYLETLTTTLLRDLIFASSTVCLTSTFYLDIDRLRAIRVEMHNAIYHQICGDILVGMIDQEISKSELPKARSALHVSLTAIVGTQGQWSENLENVAAEIVRILLKLEGRSTPYDADRVSLAESRLQNDLTRESDAFYRHAIDMEQRLLPRMRESINAHRRLPAIDLQEALVAPLPSASTLPFGYGAVCEPVGIARLTDPDTDLVRRFTHVVVLHWQVWADLVYLAPPDTDSEHETIQPRSPSPSVSPEPIARPVMTEGHKFLASAVVTDSDHGMPTPAPTPNPESDLQDNNQSDSPGGATRFLPSDRSH